MVPRYVFQIVASVVAGQLSVVWLPRLSGLTSLGRTRTWRHCPPAVSQESAVQAFPSSQFAHVAPPVPQLAADAVVQIPPEQQPFGQVVASHETHAPLTHC